MQGLLKIVSDYPFNPYSYYHHLKIPQRKINKAIRKDVEDLVKKKAKLVASRAGFAIYRILGFDTKILGMQTAKIDFFIAVSSKNAMEISRKLIASFSKNKVEYATVRISAQDLTAIHALASKGFRTVDAYLTLMRTQLEELKPPSKDSVIVRNAKASDIGILAERIGPTFTYSRFFMDPVVSRKSAVKMHQQWIANSIKKKEADHVLVAEYDNRPIGFITLEMDKKTKRYFKMNVGHIPLIGVDPDFRGKSVAEKLTKHAIFNWFKKQKAEAVRIETQLANIPATRAYEKLGFRLVDSSQTLRWHSST